MLPTGLILDENLLNVMRIVDEALIKAYNPQIESMFFLVIFNLDKIHFLEIVECMGNFKSVAHIPKIVKLIEKILTSRKKAVEIEKKENIEKSKKFEEQANLKLLRSIDRIKQSTETKQEVDPVVAARSLI